MGAVSGSNIEKVRAAKPRAARVFKKSGTLVGVGISRQGTGYGLKINLSRPPKQGDTLPSEIDGVPVQISVVGTIRKRSAPAATA
jgi:hypothetical protein